MGRAPPRLEKIPLKKIESAACLINFNMQRIKIYCFYLELNTAKEYKNRSSDEYGKDENGGDKHPSTLVVVPLDLEYGDRVDEGKHQQDGWVQVQQQESRLKQKYFNYSN